MDIEARRKNQDLLIEAKYIDGAFLASFTGLVTASLANRRQHFMAQKYRSWCYYVCWAIDSDRPHRDILPILFDYIARNPKFWKHYAEDVRMKYLFVVQGGKVSRIPFSLVLRLQVATHWRPQAKRYWNDDESQEILIQRFRFS